MIKQWWGSNIFKTDLEMFNKQQYRFFGAVLQVITFLTSSMTQLDLSDCQLVYRAAVLEYLAAEILELARNATCDNKKQHIVPHHLKLAISNDDE
jgi:hypothetical protein